MTDSKSTQKAVWYEAPNAGKASVADIPIPTPGDDDVLVEVVAASINPVDSAIVFRNAFGATAPRSVGEDFSGVVKGVGKNVTEFKAGDEVFGVFPKTGAFAQYLIAHQSNVAHKPKALSHEVAGALGICVLTALFGVEDAKIEAGQTVFVPGGAGGVAHLAIQLAQLAGAKVISSGSNDKSIAYIKDELKVAHVFNYKTHNSVEEVKKLTHGKGADLVIDCVWALKDYHEAVRKDGKYWAIQTAISNEEEPKKFFEGKAQFHKFSVVPTWLSTDPELRTKKIRGNLKHIAELLTTGKLKVLIGQRIKLDEVIPTLDAIFKNYGHNFGKIIVLVK